MKIVATADTHFVFSVPPDGDYPGVPEGDLLIHAGDLMYTGYPDEWYPRLGSLAAQPCPAKILVPGNHDFHIQNYTGIARAELRRKANCMLLDQRTPYIEVDGEVTVFGIPGVERLRDWAYNWEPEDLTRWLKLAYIKPADIIISHQPPYLILDAVNPEGKRVKDRKHAGSRVLRRWFNALEKKPAYWFSGHIHESYGETVVDGCKFYNVAMCDQNYKQVNPPVVIEI